MSDWPIDWRAVVDEAVKRRKQEGFTQRTLAALAGVSVPTVNAFEQGDINLRFERIVAILDSLGLFVQSGRTDSLQSFIYDARIRWTELIQDLPPDNPSRQPEGHSEQSYGIDGVERLPSLAKLREILSTAPKTSGWTPFWVPTKDSIKPSIREGLIECWIGKPDADKVFDDPGHSDFWQISRGGTAYLQRGYQEDGFDFEPGSIFDLTLPISRTSEVLLHAAWLARELGGDTDTKIRFVGRYTGLAGRELFTWAKPLLRFALGERYRARSDSVDLAITTSIGEIGTQLPQIIEGLLRPLYERFDGFDPPSDLFAGQIEDLLKNIRANP
ncbi:helix-turn-helix domain-containing protein [Sphingomonas crusticola]|uniref:helix-turn-helix domain-containing protein n=1 Tax=Sphingomonas crusticola TaxID=1697973 RepID=UPI000E262F3F|nr:helix-turn-helix domain-containing protein [Sphingomonas crusticola]